MSEASQPDGSHPESGRLPNRALALLDVIVVAFAVILALYLAIGPLQIGPVGVHRVSKPLLLLLLLGALRAAIPRSSWFSRALVWLRRRLGETLVALERRTAWTGAFVDAAFAVLSVHVPLKGVTFFANVLFRHARTRPFRMPFAAQKLAETCAAWDSGWYFDVARRGYYYNASGPSSVAFFPLYPMLMRALAWPFGGSDRALWLSGIVLSWVSFFLGLAVLHRLTERMFRDRRAARRTVLYVAVFPFAYFFTQVYTESLFLLVSVSAVAAATASFWAWAGFFGGLAALTRPNGILIAAPLLLLAMTGRPSLRELARRAAGLSLVPLGLGLYCLFVYGLAGDPLAWLTAQDHWGYTLGHKPWAELLRLIDQTETQGLYGYFLADRLAPFYFIHGLTALVFVALLPAVYRRVGPALAVYAAVSLLIPLTGNALEGIGRYCATLFPFFMVLGVTTSKRAHETLLIGSALLLALLASLFATFHPIY